MTAFSRRAIFASSRRGAFLIEVLVVVVLMTAAAVLAGELLMSSLKVMQETKKRDTLIGRVDTALDALRRDAWAADSAKVTINVEPGDVLQFHIPAGDVTWRMNSTTLTRTDAAGTRSWIEVPLFQFAVGARGTIRVVVASGPGGAAKQEHLTLATPRITGGAQ
ncbi:MAG TPA: hypothetical protein VHM90_10090 [Phycisphaerae bacterium]|jgi:type II secretory pathway pseudopilin PulG|nr:hypothetical protein [Phycisphaerae bacterium]